MITIATLDAFAGQFNLAAVSATLGAMAYFPYLRDTHAGRTRPQRATWLIWTVLSAIAFAAQWHAGATHTLWFAGSQVLGCFLVFTMAISKGSSAIFSRTDCLVMLGAAAGLILWWHTDQPSYALAVTISISLAGGLLTVAKANRAPGTETLSKWVIAWIASGVAILSVGTVDWVLIAYPAYLLVLNSLIISAVLLGRLGAVVQVERNAV